MIKVKISAIEYRNNWGRREEAGFSRVFTYNIKRGVAIIGGLEAF